MAIFWLEDDWNSCTAELAYCDMRRIEVHQVRTMREALGLLSNDEFVASITRFVFDVNLQIFDPHDLSLFEKTISPDKDLLGPAFFELLSKRLSATFQSCIHPKSVFYTKMVAPERVRIAEDFAAEFKVEFVHKLPGLHARRFVDTLRLA